MNGKRHDATKIVHSSSKRGEMALCANGDASLVAFGNREPVSVLLACARRRICLMAD